MRSSSDRHQPFLERSDLPAVLIAVAANKIQTAVERDQDIVKTDQPAGLDVSGDQQLAYKGNALPVDRSFQ